MTTVKKLKKPKKPNVDKLCLIPEDPATASPIRTLCQLCGLYGKATSPFMKAQVPDGWTKRLLVVGERPGADEDTRTGHPFSGKSGKLLRQWLEETGFEARDVAFTNATRCGEPGNATPTANQIRCCRPLLLWELEKLAPDTVLGVGNSALAALSNDGSASVTRTRGRELDVPRLS